MTYCEAKTKQEELCKSQPKKLHFIMGKNNCFEVFSGWDGRDKARKDGYVIPRYSLSRSAYVTDFSPIEPSVDFCD